MTVLVLVLPLAAGCGGGGGGTTGSTSSTPSRTPADFDFGNNGPLRASAFGDSITRGLLDEGIVTSNNYPNLLQSMLRGLDPGWRVVNRGVAGERTVEGVRRFPSVLANDQPGFGLVMEGTNDATREDDPAFIVANLERIVDQAIANRTVPLLATIPPNFRNDPTAQAIINAANAMIRTVARTRGIVLAEIFNGMNDRSLFGSPERGIEDPLHPNERGYAVMAGIWFAALQQAIPAPTTVTASRARAVAAPTPPAKDGKRR